MIDIIFILISELTCPVDGVESSPIRTDMFYHRIKVISLKNLHCLLKNPFPLDGKEKLSWAEQIVLQDQAWDM